MGTDVTVHTEVFNIETGRWEHFSIPTLPRNYLIFEKICGVRGEVSEAIAPPRGLPINVSDMTLTCFSHDMKSYANPAHATPTWLSREEMKSLADFIEAEILPVDRKWALETDYWGYYFGNPWESFEGPKQYVDFRFLFWFD